MSCDVALETTVIAHGLPHPLNLRTAMQMEDEIRAEGAVPKTIGIVDGKVIVGLNKDQIEMFATLSGIIKAASSEIPIACALGKTAATTVSGTIRLASLSGIRVMATGGIGGVHRDIDWDVSQDIIELSRTPILVVSSGVKSILDIGRTLEFLETFGITVLGYRTEFFPAFHSRKSPFKVSFSVNTAQEAAEVLIEKIKNKIPGAVLLVNPVPDEEEIPFSEVDRYVGIASREAMKRGISGKALTPYLLKRLGELSDGRTLKANISLLKNNAKLAAKVAKVMTDDR